MELLRPLCKNFPKKFWSLWFFCALVFLVNRFVLHGGTVLLPPAGFFLSFVFVTFFWACVFYFLTAITLRYWKWRGAFAFSAGIIAFVRAQIFIQAGENSNSTTLFGWYYNEDKSLGIGGYIDMVLNPPSLFFMYALYLFFRRYTRKWSRRPQ